NKKGRVTQILVTLSGAVDAGAAQERGTYRLVAPGKRGSYIARNAKFKKLKSAVYNAADHTVTLVPRKPFALTRPVQLQVNAVTPSGLEDTNGRLIDGDRNGSAGGNTVAMIAKPGVTLNTLAIGDSGGQKATDPTLVDALIARDELVGLARLHREKRR